MIFALKDSAIHPQTKCSLSLKLTLMESDVDEFFSINGRLEDQILYDQKNEKKQTQVIFRKEEQFIL